MSVEMFIEDEMERIQRRFFESSSTGWNEEDLRDGSPQIRLMAYQTLGWREEALKDKSNVIRKYASEHFKRCNEVLETKNLTSFTREQIKLLEINGLKTH